MSTLRRQLIQMNVLAIVVALLVAIALLLTSGMRTWKTALVRDISIKADIIGSQCTAALTFNAPRDAEEILDALRADDQIEYAVVYTAKGSPFAAYDRKSERKRVPTAPPGDGHYFTAGHLDLTRPISLHTERIGTITIRTGLDQLRARMLQYVFGSALILVLALAVSSLLLSRLQRSITAPVTDLADLMETVSRDKDYSRRAERKGPAELLSLAGGLNDMLMAIQSRDHDLERSLAELKQAYGKLEELDRSKSEFISTVSHELRTPITSIKAFVELLLMKPNMEDDRKARLLATINKEMDRLARMVSDLLDLSRIESGVMLWRDGEVDLAEVVRSAVTAVRPLAQQKDIRIEDKAQEGRHIVTADRDRVMQVVMNLLSNALKFTPRNGAITVTTGPAGRFPGVAVAVADTGAGIPPDEIGQIFIKYHRSFDVLKNAVEGTGLGLAISRQIVEHYGGVISATSKPGEGSVFTFSIPFERQSTEHRATEN